MTKLEIIEETVAYYSEDVSRRALNERGECQYSTLGKECAVGRCMRGGYKRLPTLKNVAVGGLVNMLSVISIDDILLEQYQGHDVNFWGQLQHLHDGDKHWDEKGLTKAGNKKVTAIKKLYKDQ